MASRQAGREAGRQSAAGSLSTLNEDAHRARVDLVAGAIVPECKADERPGGEGGIGGVACLE